MLRLEGVSAGYGAAQVLFGLDLEARAGEVLCLMGRNGAGKTTALRTIIGQLRPTEGQIWLGQTEISSLPAHEVPRQGIGYVPQGRRLFKELTVAENLAVGLMTRGSDAAARERVLEMFPRLRERLGQRAETLSGGEQQMLAMGRALCVEPSVLLLDEPTEGLQPSMVEAIRDAVRAMRGQGVAIVLVEQRFDAVLSLADRVTFIENGQSRETVEIAALRADPAPMHKYVGV